MKLNKGYACLAALSLTVLSFLPSLAGGVTGYTGNVSTTGAGVAAGNGNTASAAVQLEFKVGRFIALGVYNTAGSIANPIFATPATNFPGGTTFAAVPSFITAESNLASKFDLDGTTSVPDQLTIISAMNASSNASSQDINIKGAVYSNLPASTAMSVSLSADTVTLTGGTGSAPVYVFRGVAGVPGGATVTSATPSTTPLALANRRNANGYGRFTFVGDLNETSVNLTTDGNWTGTVTISLNGL
ncbi:MAG: hypothetical protein SFU25_05580 [Candidatus Caenarcaniphilales bacterium]|nr:hypothetical protein [Candidatus Caenarcaniphilales bacterium]